MQTLEEGKLVTEDRRLAEWCDPMTEQLRLRVVGPAVP